MAYSFIVLSGLVVGVGLLFFLSVYIATVLISVLIGSWIANVVTNTSPKKSAIVQWWSIAAGYVIAFAVAFAFLNLFPLEDQVGRTTNSVVFGLVIYPVLLGAVWQVAWSLGVKRYIQNRFSSKKTSPK
jgi:multisubunit Na+/H+ antiporter MnhE subunit